MRKWSARPTVVMIALGAALGLLSGPAHAADADRDGVDDAGDLCIGDDASGDADGDGWCARSVDGTEADCDEADEQSFPDAGEACDGTDNDCDGRPGDDELDADQDGVFACGGDCDDFDASSAPGNVEICDEADNDCDGVVDVTGDASACDGAGDEVVTGAETEPDGCYCGTPTPGAGAWLAAGALIAALRSRR